MTLNHEETHGSRNQTAGDALKKINKLKDLVSQRGGTWQQECQKEQRSLGSEGWGRSWNAVGHRSSLLTTATVASATWVGGEVVEWT